MKKQWKRIASAVMMCAVLCLCAGKVNATEIASADSAIISVEAYEIEEGALVAGEEVTINLTIKNNSTVTDAQNVMVTFDSANYALMPVYGEGNQVYIGNIPAGVSKDITLRAAVNRAASAVTAVTTATLSYGSSVSRSGMCWEMPGLSIRPVMWNTISAALTYGPVRWSSSCWK